MLSLRKLLYGCGAGVTLLALGCNDYLTGQESIPQGPIQIERLTLFDAASRDHAVFTDTSLPDCAPVENNMIDCSTTEAQQMQICRVCFLDVLKDMYSTKKSPPTPDSGQDIRVVFNKPALLFNDQEMADDYDPVADKSTTDAGKMDLAASVNLSCPNCAGLPLLQRHLVITGSDITFDPTTVPYGPALQLVVDPTDPRATLEPDSAYTVQVDPRIAGRDGMRLMAPDPTLLSFKTEPFQALSVGEGATQAWVYADKTPGMYNIADHPRDAAVVIAFNAPLHVGSLSAVAAMATKQGGVSVPIKIGADAFGPKDMMGNCAPHAQRLLYIYPDGATTWPTDASEVDILIPGGSLFDAAQGGTFDKGKHSIDNMITVTVKFAAMTGTGYTTVSDAMKVGTCQ